MFLTGAGNMDILEGVLPAYLLVIADTVFAVLMFYAALTAPWYKIRESESSHVFLGACLLTGIIWLVRSDVVNGINFHLLCTTTLYLMFDWQFALFAIVIVNLGMYFNDAIALPLVPFNVLMLGGVPILVTRMLLIISRRYLPPNFFVYIFVNCFFSAALSMLAVAFATVSLYFFFAHHEVFQMLQNFLPFSLLLAIPEAAINGIIMSGLVAYRPAWVATFHDRFYIDGK